MKDDIKVEKKQTKSKQVMTIVYYIFVGALLLILIAGVVARANGKELTLFGYKPVIAVSGSMLPTIEVNSMSIMKKCTIDEVEVGDIVVYQSNIKNTRIIHRLIEQVPGEESFIAKGDNNDYSDPETVNENNLVGKVLSTYNWTSRYLSIVIEDGVVKPIGLAKLILVNFIVLTAISWLVYVAIHTIKEKIFKHRK